MVRHRLAGMAPIVLTAALVLGACSSSKTTTGASSSASAKPTITVGAVSFAENQIVAEMYAQVLSHAGYPVKTNETIGQREILQPAMPSQIQVAPEYIGSLLAYLKGTPSGDPAAELSADNQALSGKGLTMLNYSPANDTNAFVVTKANATKYKLATVSDLKAVASQLTLGGPTECPIRDFCLKGLQSLYGITGLKFQDTGKACGAATTQALAADQVQVALMCSTDPAIATNGWVALQDDKHLQQADNITPEVANSVLSTQVRSLLNGVSAKLTTENITSLVADVQTKHMDASAVAKTFLTQQGLLK